MPITENPIEVVVGHSGNVWFDGVFASREGLNETIKEYKALGRPFAVKGAFWKVTKEAVEAVKRALEE